MCWKRGNVTALSAILISFSFSFGFECSACATLMFWATQRASFCVWFMFPMIPSRFRFYFSQRYGWYQGAWQTSCHYIRSLHKRSRTAAARLLILHQYALAGHLNPLDGLLCLLRVLLVYRWHCFLTCFASFAARFHLYARPVLVVHPCAALFLFHPRVDCLFLRFCLFLSMSPCRNVLFRTCFEFLYNAQLSFSFLWPAVRHIAEGRMEEHSYRLPAALRLSCTHA